MAFTSKEAMQKAARESNLLQAIQMELFKYAENPKQSVKVAEEIARLVRENDSLKPQTKGCSCVMTINGLDKCPQHCSPQPKSVCQGCFVENPPHKPECPYSPTTQEHEDYCAAKQNKYRNPMFQIKCISAPKPECKSEQELRDEANWEYHRKLNCEHHKAICVLTRRYKPGQAFLTSNGDSQRYWELRGECLKDCNPTPKDRCRFCQNYPPQHTTYSNGTVCEGMLEQQCQEAVRDFAEKIQKKARLNNLGNGFVYVKDILEQLEQ